MVIKNLEGNNFSFFFLFTADRSHYAAATAYLLDRPCNNPTCRYYPEYKTSLQNRSWVAAFKDLLWLKRHNSDTYYKNLDTLKKMMYHSHCRFSFIIEGRFRSSAGPKNNPVRWIRRKKFFFNVFASKIVNAFEEHDIHNIVFGVYDIHKLRNRRCIVKAELIEFCPIHDKRRYKECQRAGRRGRLLQRIDMKTLAFCSDFENFDLTAHMSERYQNLYDSESD